MWAWFRDGQKFSHTIIFLSTPSTGGPGSAPDLCVEKKLLLSLLSIKRSLGSKKDGSDWLMMPELLNKVF